MRQVIFSIRPQFVELILSRKKTVEVRNRVVRLNEGTNVWVYATAPISGIVAWVEVESVTHDVPSKVWRRFKDEMGIDKVTFDSYTANSELVSALKLGALKELDKMTLDKIRQSVETFHPPQFYANLSPESELFRILNSDAIMA